MIKFGNIIKIISVILLAYVTTVCMAVTAGYGITGIDILLPCVFALCCVVYGYVVRGERYRSKDMKLAIPVGVIFSLGVTVGSIFDMDEGRVGSFGIVQIASLLVLAIFFTCVMLIVFGMIDITGIGDRRSARQRIAGLPIIAIIILVCWLPYYLTLFPGNMGKDTFESIDMCLGNISWTNHHPIFFTLLIDIVLKATAFTGSYTVSMGIFTLLQMVICAAAYAYIIRWVWKKAGVSWAIAAFVLYALHPASAMFSMYISKDVLFSMATVMFVLKLADILKDSEVSWKNVVASGIYAALMMLLRNNGLFIIVAFAIVLLIYIFRSGNTGLLRVEGTVILAIVVFGIFRLAFGVILGIESESFAESASVPLQQVGYVIVHDEESIDEADAAFLSQIMEFDRVKQVYTLGYTDTYKFDDSFDDEFLNKNTGEFIKVWAHMLPSHFGDYVAAYLAQTLGYWHYGETNTLCTQGVWDGNAIGVERVDVIENVTGVSLCSVIEKLMLLVRKAPILCILTSMAMQIYMLIILVALSARTDTDRTGLLIFSPLVLLWVTVMIAAPAYCLFRYTYPLFVMWPVMGMYVLRKND